MSCDHYLIVYRDLPLTPGKASGGAEMATNRLAQYLVKAGKKVVVAALLAEESLKIEGVEYWNYGSDYQIGRIFSKAQQRFGLFHLLAVGNACPLVVAREYSGVVSKIFVCHDRHASDAGFSLPVVSKLSHAFCVVSQAHCNEVLSRGADASKIQILFNGVDIETFTPKGDVPRDPCKLIFAGALVQDKGLHVLLQAYAQLKPQFEQLSLDIYGSAAMWGREPIFDEAQLESQLPGIKFKGAMNQPTLAKAFAGASIFVFPSIWFECFPLTCLEAQASGCAVVAFDVGGVKEGLVDGTTGIVVKEISAPALTQALSTLLTQPGKAEQMGRAGMQHIQNNFRWDMVSKRIVNLCDSIVP